MVDCAASIRAAGGSSSDLLTPRGLTAIYTGATDKYIKRLVRIDVSQRARIYICLLPYTSPLAGKTSCQLFVSPCFDLIMNGDILSPNCTFTYLFVFCAAFNAFISKSG